METIIETINSFWKMKLIVDSINIFNYIVLSLPVAVLFLLIYEPVKDYFYYHFTGKVVKVLVFTYFLLLVSLNITQTYLNFQINRGVFEKNKKLSEPELWLMRVIEKDAVIKLEKLEKR